MNWRNNLHPAEARRVDYLDGQIERRATVLAQMYAERRSIYERARKRVGRP